MQISVTKASGRRSSCFLPANCRVPIFSSQIESATPFHNAASPLSPFSHPSLPPSSPPLAPLWIVSLTDIGTIFLWITTIGCGLIGGTVKSVEYLLENVFRVNYFRWGLDCLGRVSSRPLLSWNYFACENKLRLTSRADESYRWRIIRRIISGNSSTLIRIILISLDLGRMFATKFQFFFFKNCWNISGEFFIRVRIFILYKSRIIIIWEIRRKYVMSDVEENWVIKIADEVQFFSLGILFYFSKKFPILNFNYWF